MRLSGSEVLFSGELFDYFELFDSISVLVIGLFLFSMFL